MNARELFTEGQEINTLRITDNGEIQKLRVFSKVGSDEVTFKGLRGSFKIHKSYNGEIVFYQGDNQLTIIK